MKRRILLVSLAMGSALLCFAMVEYGYGLYFGERVPQVTKEFDPILGWRLIPGSYPVKPMYRLQGFLLRHNSFGLRGPEISPAPGEGVRRVLVLGDSFTYSRQWPEEALFTTLLEKRLNQRSSEQYEVVNAGVQGYGTAQQLLLARKLAEEKGLRAQVYLLMVYTNDILDNLRLSYGNRTEEQVRPGFEVDPDGRLRLRDLPDRNFSGSDTLQPLRKREPSRLLALVKGGVGSWLQRHPAWVRRFSRLGFPVRMPRAPGLLNGWYEQDVLSRGVPLLRGLLRGLREEAEENGAVLRVAMIPSPLQVYPETYEVILRKSPLDRSMVEEWLADPLRPQRIVRQICEELGLSFLDLHPLLAEHQRVSLYVPGEGHFSRLGHAVTGKGLGDFILAESEGKGDD